MSRDDAGYEPDEPERTTTWPDVAVTLIRWIGLVALIVLCIWGDRIVALAGGDR